MHETSIASSIVETALRIVSENGGGDLRLVRVAVGELSAVEPDLLRFAWEALTDDHVPRPDLEIEWKPARQFCSQCAKQAERSTGSWLRICPDCGTPLNVEGGGELDIVQVVFDQQEGAPREEL